MRNYGFAEIVALCLVAAMCLKECYLSFCFHAFGDNALPETLSHGDHRTNDCGVVRVCVDVTYEGLVDLQGIDRKLFQVAQTGIPSAEVIYREAHSDGFERAEHRGRRFSMLHEHALRKFKLQIPRIQTSIPQNSAKAIEKALAPELRRRYVHRHGSRMQTRINPVLCLPARFP